MNNDRKEENGAQAGASKVIGVRVSELEYAQLNLRAIKKGLSVSAYVREELFRKR